MQAVSFITATPLPEYVLNSRRCTAVFAHAGGWPFGGVPELSEVLPVAPRLECTRHGHAYFATEAAWLRSATMRVAMANLTQLMHAHGRLAAHLPPASAQEFRFGSL